MHAPLPSLYAQTAEVVRGILPVIFAGAGVIALTGIVPDVPVLRSLAFLGATVAGAVVAYAACLFVLSHGAVAGSEAFGTVRSGSGVLFVMAWTFPPTLLLLVEILLREVSGAGVAAANYLAMAEGLVCLFLLARYGTVYPAIVDRGDMSLAAAGERVPTGAVFWRVLGASMFGVAVLTGILVLFFILDAISPPGIGLVVAVAARLATYTCILSIAVAVVVVLCNAYRGAYGPRRV